MGKDEQVNNNQEEKDKNFSKFFHKVVDARLGQAGHLNPLTKLLAILKFMIEYMQKVFPWSKI